MNIRIISGRYGGRKLDTPDNTRTHPMSERVRNALFNSLGDRIIDADILDAFAGTGALGLESLRRGAKKATFIEKDRIAQKILHNNIATLGVESTTKSIATTVSNWAEAYNGDGFDI